MLPGNQLAYHHPTVPRMKPPKFNAVQPLPSLGGGPQFNATQSVGLPSPAGGIHQGTQAQEPNGTPGGQQGLSQAPGQPPMGQPGSSNTSPLVQPTVPRPYGPPSQDRAPFTEQQGVPYGNF